MMHLSMNPDYFKGTVVEVAAAKLLRERAAAEPALSTGDAP